MAPDTAPNGDQDRVTDSAAAVALAHHCRLSIETMHPRFARTLPLSMSVVLTVNSGYE